MRPPSPAHAASAKTRRALRRDSWRSILRASFDHHGHAVERWAADAGVGRSCAHRTVSREGGDEMQLADVETLPLEVRRDVVEQLAESCGATLADLPITEANASDVLLLADVVSKAAVASKAYAEAIADGRIDAAEATAMERAATEAMRALASLRLRAREAVRERLVGVRVVSGGKGR